MSCPNATAPINIDKNTANTCNLKCEYSFTYQTTNLVASNKGEYLSFRPDSQDTPPVTYNSDKYNVDEMRIYNPSLHTYSGANASAEIVIVHSNVTGSGNLLVCIPIISGDTISNSTTTLDTLISQLAKLAPTAGSDAGTISLSSFTFGQIVPLKPFYSYTGTLPYSPCNGTYNYVVYSKENAISMTSTAFKVLNNITSVNTYNTHSVSDGLYYNSTGPVLQTSGGDIYIDCQPTGSDGEVLIGDTSTTSSLFDSNTISNIMNSGFLQVIIGVLLMIGLMAMFKYGINKMNITTTNPTEGGGGGGRRGMGQ